MNDEKLTVFMVYGLWLFAFKLGNDNSHSIYQTCSTICANLARLMLNLQFLAYSCIQH